jgi:hypothetical protein
MATVIFQGLVLTDTVRVVDFGTGQTPRLAVELQLGMDAMGARGWGRMSTLTVDQLAALLIAAHVIT